MVWWHVQTVMAFIQLGLLIVMHIILSVIEFHSNVYKKLHNLLSSSVTLLYPTLFSFSGSDLVLGCDRIGMDCTNLSTIITRYTQVPMTFTDCLCSFQSIVLGNA